MKKSIIVLILLLFMPLYMTGCQKETEQMNINSIPSETETIAPEESNSAHAVRYEAENDSEDDDHDAGEENDIYIIDNQGDDGVSENTGNNESAEPEKGNIYVIDDDEEEDENADGDDADSDFPEPEQGGVYVIDDDDEEDENADDDTGDSDFSEPEQGGVYVIDDDEEDENADDDTGDSDFPEPEQGGVYVIDDDEEDENADDDTGDSDFPEPEQGGVYVIDDDEDDESGADDTSADDDETEPANGLRPIDTYDGYEQIILKNCYASVYLITKSGKGDYSAAMAVDGVEESCWQFSLEDMPLGKAFIVLEFAKSSTIDELWIKNGFWKINVYDQYTRNGRIKTAGISFQYEGESTFENEIVISLKDDTKRKDAQKISLGRHENVQAIKIRVLSIYKGSKFPKDVAVSEIMPVMNRYADASSLVPRSTPDVSMLKLNSSGEQVLQMKERLQALGYISEGKNLTVVYTESVSEKIKQFQKKNGLPQTGIADSETLTLLYSDKALPK